IKDKLLKTDRTPKLSLLSPDKEIYIDLLNLKLGFDKEARLHKNKIFGKRYDFTKNLIRYTFFGKEENIQAQEYNEGANKLIDFYNKLNYAEILRIRVPNL